MKMSSSNVEEVTSELTNTHRVVQVPPKQLIPHPKNKELYGDAAPSDTFLDSIREQGILTPIIATKDNIIISGHQRHAVAITCGLSLVPVVYSEDNKDEHELLELVLESNQARHKSNETKIREFMAYSEVETHKAKHRQSTKGVKGVKKFAPEETGKTRDIAAKKVGLSGVTAESGAKVLKAVASFREKGRDEDADRLLKCLNDQSIHAAAELAKANGWLHTKTKPKADNTRDRNNGTAAPAPKVAKPISLPEGMQRNLGKAVKPVSIPSRSGPRLNLAELGAAIPQATSEAYYDIADESDSADDATDASDEEAEENPQEGADPEEDNEAPHRSQAEKLRNLDQALDLLEKVNNVIHATPEIPEEKRHDWREAAEFLVRNLRTLEIPVDA